MVAVILLSLVLAVVGLTIYNAAIDNVTTSAFGVQRDQALQAAESGIDMAYQKIAASSSLSTVPCSTTVNATPVTGTLGSAPSASQYKVSFRYYTTLTSRTAITSCAALSSAKAVELVSTGTDLTQKAIVQSEANLSAVTLNTTFPNAIFTKGKLTFSGNTTIIVSTKTIYVTGTFICTGNDHTNSEQITVIGSVTIKCPLTSIVRATKTITVTATGSGHTGGVRTKTLYSTTATHRISISKCPTIEGSLYAKGSITFSTAACKAAFTTTAHPVTTGGTVHTDYYSINAYDSSLTPPPTEIFPTEKWTTTGTTTGVPGWNKKPGWKALSKTVITNCTRIYTTYIDKAASASTVTGTKDNLALFTTCAITFPSLAMQRSLAVFSTGGFRVKQSTTISKAAGATPLTLMMIVPSYKNGTGPGTAFAPGPSCKTTIKITGHIGATVNAFFYTPCNIITSGTATIAEGEFYAETSFTPGGNITLGTPPKTISGGSGGAKKSGPATFGVIYIREVS